MTVSPEERAARLFEDYWQACIDGERPDLEAYVARCPEPERTAFRDAAAGMAFAQANYEPQLARPEVVTKVAARIAQIGERRERLALAQARTSIRGAREPIRNAVAFLAGLLDIRVPEDSAKHELQPVAMYRTTSPGSKSRAADRARTELRRQRAETAAEALLERLGMRQLPIEPSGIAAALGVLVVEDVVEDCDGAVVVDQGAAGIVINSAVTSPGRRRFTLAHELGHLVLHEDRFRYRIDRLADIEGQATDEMEESANYFAAGLLMPLSLISQEYTGALPSLELADQLAQECVVSTQAAARRIVTTSDHACALLVLEDSRLAWAVRSSSWPGPFVPSGTQAPRGSAAATVLRGRKGDEDEVVLLADEWAAAAAATVDVYEEARNMGSGRALVIQTLAN